jgi:hypothetical protein
MKLVMVKLTSKAFSEPEGSGEQQGSSKLVL